MVHNDINVVTSAFDLFDIRIGLTVLCHMSRLGAVYDGSPGDAAPSIRHNTIRRKTHGITTFQITKIIKNKKYNTFY